MASTKILFLNSFLERRNKKKNNKKGSNNNTNKKKDDLDLVKAAAWAWYEHGSGSSEGNNKGLMMNEFDITTTRTTHQRTSTRPPSRYKLEAMKRMAELNNDHHHEEEGGGEENNIKTHRKKENSVLFDAYEVQSISRQIDSHIVIESNKNKNNTSSSSTSLMMKKKNKKEKTKGFWLRHGVVCGRGEDVVDPATSAIKGGGRRQQASRVPDLVK